MEVMPIPAAPSLVFSPHPILAAAGRELHYAAFLPGESIAEYLDRAGVRLGSQPWMLAVDGHPVPREWWGRVRPKPGTLITLRAVVQKGGGGKNPLATILSIAMMVVAPQISFAMFAAEGMTAAAFAASTFGMIATGAISMAGNLLIGALLPPSQPHLSQVNGNANALQVSPTYALTGGSNRARPYEPLPLVMGRHRIFPDLGAKSFTEFIGDDMFLYETFNFGLSDIALSDWKIGDTPLADFKGVQIFQAGADGKLPGFPSNVDTIAGAALTAAAGWVTRTSSVDAIELGIDLQGTLFTVIDGNMSPLGCAFEMEYRPVAGGAWLPFREDVTLTYANYWSKGYYTNAWPVSVWIQADYGSTTAGDHVDGASAGTVKGVIPETGEYGDIAVIWHWRPYSEILSGGVLTEPAPKRTYTTDTNALSLSSSSRKPIRKSYKKTVASGQYEVRMRRVTADATAIEQVSEFTWSALKTYQTDTADYTGQRRVGVKIKASGQLNGTVDQFNAVATASCRYWDTGTAAWAYGPTRNPAWWYLYFVNGKRHPTTNRITFGCGLADTRCDIEGIKAWVAFCDTKGLTFDAVFDSSRSRADYLNIIARCGRGSPTWATGNLGAIWDAASQPHVAVFSMGNIIAGSFRVQYATEKLADEIVLSFFNEDTWKQDSVRVTVPGYGGGYQPTRPAATELFGCAVKTMAGKEANLAAAAQRYLRRRVMWETDFEGMVAQRGDVVILSHDLTQWAHSGRLVAATASSLTFDRPTSYTAGSPYVMVTKPDGTDEIRAVNAFAGEADTITLVTPLSFDPGADPDYPVWDYKYVFEPQATPGRRVKIVGVPRVTGGGSRIQFVAQDDDDAYYAAESGDFTWAPGNTLAQPLPTISNLTATEEWTLVGNSYAVKLILTWDVDGAVDHANVAYSFGAEDLQHFATTRGRRSEILVPTTGAVSIEVSLMNALGGLDVTGGVATLTHTLGGMSFAPSDVPLLVVQDVDGLALCRWPQVADPTLAGYEIRFDLAANDRWEDASTVTETTRGTQVTTAIVPPGTWRFFIKAHDAAGNLSINAATVVATIANPNTVIEQVDEALVWELGTLTHVIIHGPTRALVPQSQDMAQDAGWLTFDSYVPNPYMDSAYQTPEYDLGSSGQARVYGTLISKLGPNETGIADPDLQLSTRISGAAGPFVDWDVGYTALRYFTEKIVFDHAEGMACVTGFTPTADAKKRTVTGSATVAAGGSTVTFPTRFFLPPQVTTGLDGTTAGSASSTGVAGTGFTGYRFNAAGTDVGGAITYTAQGA